MCLQKNSFWLPTSSRAHLQTLNSTTNTSANFIFAVISKTLSPYTKLTTSHRKEIIWTTRKWGTNQFARHLLPMKISKLIRPLREKRKYIASRPSLCQKWMILNPVQFMRIIVCKVKKARRKFGNFVPNSKARNIQTSSCLKNNVQLLPLKVKPNKTTLFWSLRNFKSEPLVLKRWTLRWLTRSNQIYLTKNRNQRQKVKKIQIL